MKYFLLALAILFIANISFSKDIVLTGKEASAKISNAEIIRYKGKSTIPAFVKFKQGSEIESGNFVFLFLKQYEVKLQNNNLNLKLERTDSDKLGFLHNRYQLTYNSIPIEFAILIAHSKNGKVFSCNGELPEFTNIDLTPSFDENTALIKAKEFIPAEVYKWQISGEERFLKQIKNNPLATYFPKAEMVIFSTKDKGLRLAYKLNIYAHKPLKRADIYIDAINGEKLFENNQIRNSDAIGTANTKYSGIQTITADSYGGGFRLRETGRGNGIETYDMNMGSDYGAAVDFTDTDNYWDNYNTELDEVAADAHWGAEKTYDYFKNKHTRNSIDDNGFALLSYVHADLTAFGLGNNVNAFWDGNVMTYGDGSATVSPLTTLDICGHEITHGLVTFTANLNSDAEPGALNEGFADIFGTCIEFYAKPADANWTVGEDIDMIIRDMGNPSATGNPDTYQGQDWDPNQEVHANSTVVSHWFYLVSVGGSGTNDNGDSYTVSGISIDAAAVVAYRTLAYYLTPSSDYADTRFNSILSAIDIFGSCSPEVEAVTNAWYAVGVGGIYVPAVISNFTADFTTFCAAPATVQFNNQSNNGTSFIWSFGDGSTSFEFNPSHVYTANGTYPVTLFTDGGSCGSDTLTLNAFININPANPCIVILPTSGSSIVTYCAGLLYDNGGMNNYQDQTDVTVTIAPPGASQIVLNFTSFNFEAGYDYLYIYDGPNASSALIGQFDGSTLPNGGTITSTFGSITLRQTTDQAVNESGFEMNWQCQTPTAPPAANFNANFTTSCTGEITFNDFSSNNPNAWLWNFGDGYSSTSSQPTHFYNLSGTYTVSLIAINQFGSDTIIKTNFIIINLPVAPIVVSDTICNGENAHLYASGSGNLNWYNISTGGSLLFTGSLFNTPALTASTTYYVENELLQVSQYVGKIDNTGPGGYYTGPTEHFLIFDVIAPITLISVKVYANTSGVRTVNLQNSQGTILQFVSPDFPQGESRITLNFAVPVGTNYQLAISPGNCDLYRNGSQSGTALPYPYSIANLVSIKNNSASNLVYYYYFYDWEVIGETCTSTRVPVTAIVENCSRIEKIINSNATSIYPVPVSDILYIEMNSSDVSQVAFTIYNANGYEIRKIQKSGIIQTVDVSNLPEGFYYLKIQSINNSCLSTGNVEIKKFCIIH